MDSPRTVFLGLAALLLTALSCTPQTGDVQRAEPAVLSSRVLASTTPEPSFRLPVRKGPRPETTDAPPGTPLAHRQLSQIAPTDLQERLFTRAAALPDVRVAPSGISVPGARAFWLRPEASRGPRAAFQVGTEFAHIHPAEDGSLHLTFPPEMARRVFQQGWGMPHPRSGTPMLFGPRDEAELEVVWQLLLRSYAWAHDGQDVGVTVE
ncbi:phospholipase [Corallococcus macrosporus]|uniref:Phospholipase n=1 Tax=Corallococcus macrosporus TaxID=35 RepID=A0ABS3D9V2_9BACT|nr:luciferase family protein [Corallococcus macrosporus]MBN8228454.1 phospholipase [Corallococcus macrosporus]